MSRLALALGALLWIAPSCTPSTDFLESTDQMPSTTASDATATTALELYLTGHGGSLGSAVDHLREIGVELPGDLPDILHGAGVHAPRAPGQEELAVDVGHGVGRRVYLRVPKGYDPTRAYPLLLAYHSGGGTGTAMVSSAVRLLGRRADSFLIAAPHNYRQTGLDHPLPVSSEHAAVLRAVKGHVHVDSDRVYVTGFSTGGYTAWFLATLQPDLFAGAVPMAAAFSVPMDEPGLAELFLPNLRHLPVVNVWGGRDRLNVPGLNGRRTRDTMAQLNRRLGPMLERAGLDNVVHHEVPNAGHGGYQPPAEPLERLLSTERIHSPRSLRHRFRYIHQGHAYWVEGHRWQGALWDTPWPQAKPRRGESRDQATGRTIRELLGEIRAEADGQTFTVDTTHLADFTVWLDDELIADWSRPVRLVVGGRTVFDAVVEPDLAVALHQAKRTFDFDRIRWAGIRVDTEAGTARVVTTTDTFPPVLREVVGR